MIEFLLVAVCLSGAGCGEASKAYVETRPELEQNVRLMRQKYGTYVNPFLPLAPILRGQLKARINKYYNLQIEQDRGILVFRYEF